MLLDLSHNAITEVLERERERKREREGKRGIHRERGRRSGRETGEWVGGACPPDMLRMYSKKHLPDIEQWSRAVAPTSSRGGLVLA